MDTKNLNTEQAEKFLKKAVRLKPNNFEANFNLANIYKQKGDFYKAKFFYEKTIKIEPNNPSLYNNLANICKQLGEFTKAINLYNKAIDLKPNYTRAYHNLGNAYNQLGKFSNAIQIFKKVYQIDPTNLEGLYIWSELDEKILNIKLKKKINSIMINNNLLKKDLAYGNFLLAKYEFKEKNFENELNYLMKGHQIYYESKKNYFDGGLNYWLKYLPNVEELENLKVGEISTKIKPIFIIGVPRCGSTVIEKIIASGKKYLPMSEESGVISTFVGETLLAKKSLDKNIKYLKKKIDEKYQKLNLVKEKCDNTFTDKTLENFFFLFLIKKIYPEAKIINCQRNPLASIISIIKNNLHDVPWAHDEENIFSYFDTYFKKVENFKKKFPNFIYDLNFENFQNTPEKEAKKLIKFCNLEWDEKCLKFYKRKDIISYTSSHRQIRKPIYSVSINRHLPYRKLLYKFGKKYDWFI